MTTFEIKYDKSNVHARFTQAGHNLPILTPVYHDGTSWIKAKVDSDSTVATALVVRVVDVDTIDAGFSGIYNVGTHSLTLGKYYFTSDLVSGVLSETNSELSNPIVQVITAQEIRVLEYRPMRYSLGY